MLKVFILLSALALSPLGNTGRAQAMICKEFQRFYYAIWRWTLPASHCQFRVTSTASESRLLYWHVWAVICFYCRPSSNRRCFLQVHCSKFSRVVISGDSSMVAHTSCAVHHPIDVQLSTNQKPETVFHEQSLHSLTAQLCWMSVLK
jgi:hypothetical protein